MYDLLVVHSVAWLKLAGLSLMQCINAHLYIIATHITYNTLMHIGCSPNWGFHPQECNLINAAVLEEVGCPTSCPDDLVIFKHKHGECTCMADLCKVRYERSEDTMCLVLEERGHGVLSTRGARTRCP